MGNPWFYLNDKGLCFLGNRRFNASLTTESGISFAVAKGSIMLPGAVCGLHHIFELN